MLIRIRPENIHQSRLRVKTALVRLTSQFMHAFLLECYVPASADEPDSGNYDRFRCSHS
jgi:hypothetical protein